MSSVVLASQKEAMPADQAEALTLTSYGAEAFGHTLRRILSPDGKKPLIRQLTQIVSDDELRDETLSHHSSHGQEAINLLTSAMSMP